MKPCLLNCAGSRLKLRGVQYRSCTGTVEVRSHATCLALVNLLLACRIEARHGFTRLPGGKSNHFARLCHTDNCCSHGLFRTQIVTMASVVVVI